MATLSSEKAISHRARLGISRGDWQEVHQCANALLALHHDSAEGLFLLGKVALAASDYSAAKQHFSSAYASDPNRHDVTVELSHLEASQHNHSTAHALLESCPATLWKSPYYLDMASSIYTNIGMPDVALPLIEKAHKLQPEIDTISSNLAACLSYNGLNERAVEIYEDLLAKHPGHQRNHYFLAQLPGSNDKVHVDVMLKLLQATKTSPRSNIFLFYALARRLERMKDWPKAFDHYSRGAAAVRSALNYKSCVDLEQLRALTRVLPRVLDSAQIDFSAETFSRPIFIVGLPRTGSTLVERILSSHSQVESLGETRFAEIALKSALGPLTPEALQIRGPVGVSTLEQIRQDYFDQVAFRLRGRGNFIDKLPMNFQILPLLAMVFPDAAFVYTSKSPMATCFSMFKQLFTGAYPYSYDLDELGAYYCAHREMLSIWEQTLGARLISISYESLVNEPEAQTRYLLQCLDLSEEPLCFEPQKNPAASMTASATQIRDPIRSDLAEQWRHYNDSLAPLEAALSPYL